MPIISVEIMKKIGEEETQKTKQNKTQKKKKRENKGDANYSERYKWFCWAFKLGFLQLICKLL